MSNGQEQSSPFDGIGAQFKKVVGDVEDSFSQSKALLGHQQIQGLGAVLQRFFDVTGMVCHVSVPQNEGEEFLISMPNGSGDFRVVVKDKYSTTVFIDHDGRDDGNSFDLSDREGRENLLFTFKKRAYKALNTDVDYLYLLNGIEDGDGFYGNIVSSNRALFTFASFLKTLQSAGFYKNVKVVCPAHEIDFRNDEPDNDNPMEISAKPLLYYGPDPIGLGEFSLCGEKLSWSHGELFDGEQGMSINVLHNNEQQEFLEQFFAFLKSKIESVQHERTTHALFSASFVQPLFD